MKMLFEDAQDEKYLHIEFAEDPQPDIIAIRVLEQKIPEYLVPVSISRTKDTVVCRYTIPEGTVRLCDLGQTMTKTDFLKLYRSLLAPILEAESWLLDSRSFIADSEYVYVDLHTGRARFIYLPDHGCKQVDEDIWVFLKSAFVDVIVEDDSSLLLKLFRFFEGKHEKDFETLIEILDGESLGNDTAVDEPASSVKVLQEMKEEVQQEIPQEVAYAEELPPTAIEEEIQPEFLSEEPVSDLPEEEVYQKEVFSEISAEEPEIVHGCLALLTSAYEDAPEKIPFSFTKETLTIGRISKANETPDIAFPNDFKAIGRNHAQLVCEGKEIFLIDCGSANRTTLNGDVLEAEKAYPVTDGSEIGFTTAMPVIYRLVLDR